MNDHLQTLELHLKDFACLDPDKIKSNYHYLELLLQANQRSNLTSITGWEEAVIKHLYDSLMLTEFADLSKTEQILDLGSGAGLPGIPLALAYPEQKVYLLEASKKKAEFLELAINKLNLANTLVLNERAENLAHHAGHRGMYDLVVARAVAELAVLLELAAPFCRKDGIFIAYKGPHFSSELNEAERALHLLGMEIDHITHYDLPLMMGARTLLIFRKTTETPPQYPRRPGITEKRPLR